MSERFKDFSDSAPRPRSHAKRGAADARKNIALVVLALLVLGMGVMLYKQMSMQTTGAASDAKGVMAGTEQTLPEPAPSAEDSLAALAEPRADAQPIQNTMKAEAAPPQTPTAEAEAEPEADRDGVVSGDIGNTPGQTPGQTPGKPSGLPQPEPVQPAPERQAKPEPKPPQKPAAKTPEPRAAAGGAVNSVRVAGEDGGVVMLVSASAPLGRYRYFSLSGPPRVALDLYGDWQAKADPQVEANPLVKSVRLGGHKEYLRLVLDLKTDEAAPFTVERRGDRQLALVFK